MQPKQTSQGRASMETLEGRQFLSVSFSRGVLHVDGTPSNDTIVFVRDSADASKIDAQLNGVVVKSVPAAGLKSIVVHGGKGNDLIKVDESNGAITTPLHAHGGAGDDTMFGGSGNDQLLGEAGNDEIHGGAGNDKVDGGAGSDQVSGDAGRDTFDKKHDKGGQVLDHSSEDAN